MMNYDEYYYELWQIIINYDEYYYELMLLMWFFIMCLYNFWNKFNYFLFCDKFFSLRNVVIVLELW